MILHKKVLEFLKAFKEIGKEMLIPKSNLPGNKGSKDLCLLCGGHLVMLGYTHCVWKRQKMWNTGRSKRGKLNICLCWILRPLMMIVFDTKKWKDMGEIRKVRIYFLFLLGSNNFWLNWQIGNTFYACLMINSLFLFVYLSKESLLLGLTAWRKV